MAYYSSGNANTPDQGGGASSDTTATPKTVSSSPTCMSLSSCVLWNKNSQDLIIDLSKEAVDAVYVYVSLFELESEDLHNNMFLFVIFIFLASREAWPADAKEAQHLTPSHKKGEPA